jgi:hypothetical protein
MQPATTATDPESRPLTMLTQKPRFRPGNLCVLTWPTPATMGPAPSQVIPICVSASSSAGRKAIFCGYRMPMNGIDDVIGRSDLADRALFLTLPPIADRRRRVERQLWREFEVARPRILGSLLDAAAHGLRNVAGIHLEELPPDGRLRAVGHGMRNGVLAGWHVHTGLSGKPQGRDRGPNRRRSSSRLGAADCGEPQHVDGKCFGSPACRCSPGGSRPSQRGRGLAEEPAVTRWLPASRADVPSGPGHRHCVQS